jgi:hypothetical protein
MNRVNLICADLCMSIQAENIACGIHQQAATSGLLKPAPQLLHLQTMGWFQT